ncbi:NADPH-dependent FMN reductase [Microbacterium elymi]|uniref:NAD(P)H-dependent oxidoreductase n=1 Tax=Microbacterium elymi TaxID=2909587 RepID=A0ABY5NN90_9MICO|nr:NADPH-dependent FMN reductase [Microbacterium elymi]UUT36586.1 NAD(P)H-dependent oxidoreductase [Microbacterium elymi]
MVGSISSTSINRRLARALARLAPAGVELVEIPIKDLPFYSPDHDADFPQVARDFKQAIADVDGVIIVTPEYSRSIPGVLKNALDWSARPYGQASFDHKPTAVIGTSGGPISTAAAQQHLKAILSHYNAPTLGQPEGYIQSTPGLFGVDGAVSNEGTAAFLTSYLAAFTALIARYVDTADAAAGDAAAEDADSDAA